MTGDKIKEVMDACYLAKRVRDMLPKLPNGVTFSHIHYLDTIRRLESSGDASCNRRCSNTIDHSGDICSTEYRGGSVLRCGIEDWRKRSSNCNCCSAGSECGSCDYTVKKERFKIWHSKEGFQNQRAV